MVTIYFYLLTLVVFSSRVTRLSCTTSFMPHYPIICPVSCGLPRMPSSVLDGTAPSFARHHSETTCSSRVTPIVSACSFKEDNFTFDTLGQEFASCVTFIQFALICSFLTTYPRHSLLAHISFPSNLLSRNQYFLMYNMSFTLL